MEHKPKLSKDAIEKKLLFLRKQRDGLIIGCYRGILSRIYNQIETLCDNNDNACDIADLLNALGASTLRDKSVTINYCLDLEQIGCIVLSDSRVELVKNIDF